MVRSTHGAGGALVTALFLTIATAPPVLAQVRKDEEILFFPAAARLSDDGKDWLVPIHGWIYEPERNSFARRTLIQQLAKQLELTDKTTPQFTEPARWLLADN